MWLKGTLDEILDVAAVLGGAAGSCESGAGPSAGSRLGRYDTGHHNFPCSSREDMNTRNCSVVATTDAAEAGSSVYRMGMMSVRDKVCLRESPCARTWTNLTWRVDTNHAHA